MAPAPRRRSFRGIGLTPINSVPPFPALGPSSRPPAAAPAAARSSGGARCRCSRRGERPPAADPRPRRRRTGRGRPARRRAGAEFETSACGNRQRRPGAGHVVDEHDGPAGKANGRNVDGDVAVAAAQLCGTRRSRSDARGLRPPATAPTPRPAPRASHRGRVAAGSRRRAPRPTARRRLRRHGFGERGDAVQVRVDRDDRVEAVGQSRPTIRWLTASPGANSTSCRM